MTYITKRTSELVGGDIVNCHGLRCLIDSDILISKSHPGGETRWTNALVLNRDDVSPSVVPLSFTEVFESKEHRWTIQGNDLARWSVET